MITEKKHQTTEEMITRIREGSQQAFSELLDTYEPLVRAEVARHAAGLGHEDAQDLGQVALIALYRAAMAFDLAQNEVEFGLYAKVCISNALVSQLRALRRYRDELPLTDFLGTAAEDPATRLLEEEAAALLRARIRAVLSPYEQRVWALYTAGYRSGEIARRLEKNTHSVENAVYRIRQKLRAALGSSR